MKKALQPYLHFDNNCKEAMTFYQQLFGGELSLMPISQSPEKDKFEKGIHNQILHSSLSNGNFFLMASDMCGMGKVERGNSVQLNITCTSDEEISHVYNELSKGGKILDPLKEQFWGAKFAMVIDRFGVRWMMNYEKGLD